MKERIQFRCIEKVRDNNGRIVKYCLQALQGPTQYVTADFLKRKLASGGVIITNLKLTSDNRIIDCEENIKPTQTNLESNMRAKYPSLPNTVMTAANITSSVMLKLKHRFQEKYFSYNDANKTFNYTYNFQTDFDDCMCIRFTVDTDCKTFSMILSTKFTEYRYSGLVSELDSGKSSSLYNSMNKLTLDEVITEYSNICRAFKFLADDCRENLDKFIEVVRHLKTGQQRQPEEIIPMALVYYSDRLGIKHKLIDYITEKSNEILSDYDWYCTIEEDAQRLNRYDKTIDRRVRMTDVLAYYVIMGRDFMKDVTKLKIKTFKNSGGSEFTLQP